MADEKNIANIHSIAENFNKYFAEIGPTIANKIDFASKHFHKYHNQTSELENIISVNELKDAFFSLKINKNTVYDGIRFNVVKKCFGVF